MLFSSLRNKLPRVKLLIIVLSVLTIICAMASTFAALPMNALKYLCCVTIGVIALLGGVGDESGIHVFYYLLIKAFVVCALLILIKKSPEGFKPVAVGKEPRVSILSNMTLLASGVLGVALLVISYKNQQGVKTPSDVFPDNELYQVNPALTGYDSYAGLIVMYLMMISTVLKTCLSRPKLD